jgi:TonB-linked outer membrane protein, SusC/RagA family
MSLLANNVHSQNARIHISDYQNLTIEKFIREVESQTNYLFVYSKSEININDPVSLPEQDITVKRALDNISDKAKLSYLYDDDYIVLTKRELISLESAQTQVIPVTGTITDENGDPLPGVNIVIKGTTLGVISGADGTFSLNIRGKNDILSFSYIGYASQEIVVGEKRDFQITLYESALMMDEVVVTALGIRREEKALGYSVQKLSGDAIQTVKGVDVGTSLTGKVSGLLVKNSTEFSAAPEILIRGEAPLVVIDGVPYSNMSLRDLASDDIESINVLKGSTATALYGARGEGGAIMVTTKSGSAKNGLSVSFNSSTMFTAGYLAIPETQAAFGRIVNTSTNTYTRTGDGSWGAPLDGREVVQWDPVSKEMRAMPYLPLGKNNFSNFLEQGLVTNNNVNVVQQGEFGSFRASATWIQNKGQYPNSTFNKFTYNIGGEMKINKFTLSSNIAYNKQVSPNIGFSGYTSYDPMYNLLVKASPDFDIRDYKDYWLTPNEIQNNSYTGGSNNSYFDRYERTHSTNKDIFNGFISMNYEIMPWLKATLRSGFDTYSDLQNINISLGSFQGGGNATVIPGGTEVWGESTKGSFNTGTSRGYSFNNDFLLMGNKTIGDIGMDAFVGGSVFYQQDEGIEAFTRGGLSVPAFYSLKASINPLLVNSRVYKQQTNSIYGRLALSWKSMLFLEATGRNDWSSTLSEDSRSYFYPSVASSFVISELLPKMDWLSLWKLRGSWTTAKTPAGIYQINSVYSVTANAWNNIGSAALPTTIRGAEVLPESTSTFEIGTAINFFKNRASLDVALYSKRLFDFLRNTEISSATGYSQNYINIEEEITRKGIEVTANVTPVKTSEWQWDMSVNWSTYARYYTKLDPVFSADKPWIKVGERVDHFILYEFQKDPDGNIIHNNGQPLFSAYESKFGFSDPDWIWGFNTSLKYKNWRFNIALDGRVGGLAQTTTEMYMWRAGSHPESVVPERYLDATIPGSKNYIGKGVKVVSGEATYDTYGNITSDTRVYAVNDIPVTYQTYTENYHKGTAWGGSPSPVDAYVTTFLKIRELSLTYDLPSEICNKIRSNNISVSLIGQNVFLWAKQFKYSDPDGGSENFSDPSQRYIGFNMKFLF